MVKRLLKLSLISGLIVALWGLPSHFGYDPTCFLFRGTFDVSCWTEAFQPKVRIFSTMGQPNWLAAYLAILIPIAIALAIKKTQSDRNTSEGVFRVFWKYILYTLLIALFYVDLLFTRSQSGFLGFAVAFIFFIAAYVWLERKKLLANYKYLLSILIPIVIGIGSLTFFLGQPISQLNQFTFEEIKKQITQESQESKPQSPAPPGAGQGPALEGGGTDSGKIRRIVWQGAIEIWKHNPLFGTGVETFAFAYYRYRPAAHNLTSEWDYLYNKAHNEYLNFLATTGLFGLGTYLFMIGSFLLILAKQISKSEFLISNQIPSTKSQLGQLEIRSIRNLLTLALLAAYLSILVSNFFGFSVVMVNIYFFLIPAFVFALTGMIDTQKIFIFPRGVINSEPRIAPGQLILILVLLFTIFYLLFSLLRFWYADTSYALGYNLDRAGEYEMAYPKLRDAVVLRDEPVFQDELSYNSSILALALAKAFDATSSAEFARQATQTSDKVVSRHPNNVVFWKTRTRALYTLSQIDQSYLSLALEALKKANELAPTDAKISYNLGVLYGQTGEAKKGIKTLEKTIQLKPDYRDAYFALGLFYRDLSVDKKGNVVDSTLQKKAVESMRYILTHLAADDASVKETLKNWGEL